MEEKIALFKIEKRKDVPLVIFSGRIDVEDIDYIFFDNSEEVYDLFGMMKILIKGSKSHYAVKKLDIKEFGSEDNE